MDCYDCIHLTQERDQWKALVSTVMNLQVPENAGFSSLAEQWLVSQ
jgi:hypothetical protein